MNRAFVDSSVLLAIAFTEPGADAVRARLGSFDSIVASPLAEAEVRSAGRRESRAISDDLFDSVEWVHMDRALSREIAQVLSAGYVRGADCWHLAAALFYTPVPSSLVFYTLDSRQRDIAMALGFAT